MSKNVLVIKVEKAAARNPVVVAMNARHGGKGGHKNKAEKRASQKARRAEANAW